MARVKVKPAVVSELVDGPWALPDGWRWQRLGDLGSWCGGGTPSKARADFWSNGTIPWVSPKDMKRFVIDSTEDRITPSAVTGSSAKLIPAGSILCVMRSGILRHTFPVAVSSVGVTLNQDMRALIPDKHVDPDYIAYYLRFSGRIVLETSSKDGTTVNSIEAERLDRHPVPLPNIDTQKRVVAKVDEIFAEVDEGEAALERARGDLATWRKALLKAAISGELTADWRTDNPPAETGADLLARILAERRTRWLADPRNKGKRYVEPIGPEIRNLPDLPASWTWASIAQLSTLVTSGSRGWAEYYSDAGPLFIRAQNIKTDRLLMKDVAHVSPPAGGEGTRTRVQKHDILVTITGANVTKTAIVDEDIPEAYVSQHVGMIRPILSEISQMLYWWIITPNGGRGLLEKLAYGAGKPGLNLPNLLNLPVPLPPLCEQTEIDRLCLSASQNQTDLVETFVSGQDGAAALRQSTLSAAFRGELVA